jgi:hypothetical protein
MRGSGLARIYQPAFAAMILFIARWAQSAWEARSAARGWLAGATAAVTLANALVIFGPVMHVPLADHVYLSFYHHGSRYGLSKNLDTFGRRPLGFCDTSITIENPLTKKELRDLRERNKRRALKKQGATTTTTTTTTTTKTTAATTAPATRATSSP